MTRAAPIGSPPDTVATVQAPAFDSRAAWLAAAARLLHPLAGALRPDAAEILLSGPASNHGAAADRLESFARPLLLAAHWFAAQNQSPEAGCEALGESLACRFRRGLLAGTQPTSPHYWGPAANNHQHIVEMAALVLAFEIARNALWEPFTQTEKKQILQWLSTCRGISMHRNNHLFFGLLVHSFLQREGAGRRGDAACVTRWLDTLESMALGRGWFIDGMNETVDYYNAYAFHYYGQWWTLLYGGEDPCRVARWREWTHLFLQDYIHFFSASGESPPFGRSLIYRFAASAPFALAEYAGASPIDPGLSRRLCSLNRNFFMSRPITTPEGTLNLGWNDAFPGVAEAYSCAGSPYWAAKGFSPLLLPPEHPFWTAPATKLPSETADCARPIEPAGLLVRSHRGAVELLNAGTAICGGNTAYGTYKWGKLGYRTGVGFEITGDDFPTDSALTALAGDGTRYGRQSTHTLAVEPDHLACTYSLGDKHGQFNVQVETHLWWFEGWHLHLHRYHAHQPVRLQLGTYSLAADDAACLTAAGQYPWVRADNRSHTIAAQALAGFSTAEARRPRPAHRLHLQGPHSLSWVLSTAKTQGEGFLLALTYCETHSPQTIATLAPWRIHHSAPGTLELHNPNHPAWLLQDEALPPCPNHE